MNKEIQQLRDAVMAHNGDVIVVTTSEEVVHIDSETLKTFFHQFAELENDIRESLQDTFYEIASKDDDGWYCSNARGTAVSAGERLVALGAFTASPKNDPKSRVRWYRPKV